MKVTLQALVVSTCFCLFSNFVMAQIITSTTGGACTNFPLALTSSSGNVFKIEWIKDNSSVEQTNYREWVNPVVVAGTEGSHGTSATQLGFPKRLFVTASGSVYVTDRSGGRVQRWDPPYTTGVTVASGLDWPEDVQIDFFGNLLVSEHWGKRITSWPSGTVVANLGGGAEGIAMGPGGFIYAVEYWSARVHMYPALFNTASPSVIRAGVSNSSGNANNQLNFPGDIFVDQLGNMYVIDVDNDRLMYFPFFSVEGSPGVPLLTNFSFDSYSSIYRDNNGYLYFTNGGGAYVLDPHTNTPHLITNMGNGGLQLDASDNLYIVHSSKHCVYKLNPTININYTPTSPGWYHARVYYRDGTVSNSNSINIMQSPATPAVSSNSPVCSGLSLNLFAQSTPGSIYLWRGPAGYYTSIEDPVIINAATANSGTYTVYATDPANGCNSLRVDVNVIINASPVPSITVSPNTGTNVFCDGSPVSFTATATNGGTAPAYQWRVNGSNAGTGNTFTAPALNNGDVVSCRLTSNATCASPTSVNSNNLTMTVSPPATLSSASTCAGSVLTVNSLANIDKIEWYKDGANVFTSTTKTYTAATAGTYYAVVTSVEGCVSTTGTIVINVNNIPAVTITNPDIMICAGTAVTFTASVVNAGTNPALQWSRNGVAEGAGSSYSPLVVNNGDVFRCGLTVDADAGCVTSTTAFSNNIAMTVNPIPTVGIGSNMPNPVCGNVAETFNATTSAITPLYRWLVNGTITGGNTQTLSIPAVNNGDVVKCIVSDVSTANACTDSTFTTLIVHPLPSMAPTTGNASFCMTHFTQLANATVNTGYQWKTLQPAIATVDNAGTVQAVTPGTATIRFIASNSFGCFDSTDINVTVNALPVMQPITSASNSFSVCEQSSLQLFNTTARQSYNWLSLQPSLAIINNTGKLSALQAGTATVRFIATNASGCTDSTEASVTILHSPTPSAAIAASINPVCDHEEVVFTATEANGGASPAWQWLVNGKVVGNNSNTFASNSLKNGDVVNCRLTSNAVCALPPVVNSNAIQMQVNPLPVVSAAASRSTILKDDLTQLHGSATGTIGSVRWTPSSDLNVDNEFAVIARPLVTALYRLTVTSKEGCTDSDTIRVTVVDRFLIPNAFSPNGDGIHDRWEVEYLDKFPGATVQVFNRYGQMVYQTSSYQHNSGWDGRINGQPLPMGTYYYIIDLKNGRPKFSGSITILK